MASGTPGPISLSGQPYRGEAGEESVPASGGDPFAPESVEADPSETLMRERFLTDYLQLLDGRLGSIREHVATSHYEQARIAMLSLEAASGMIGATSLVEPLQEFRGVVDSCSAQQRAAMLARIEAEAAHVRQRLMSGEPSDESASVL